jgi:hypothetical protein
VLIVNDDRGYDPGADVDACADARDVGTIRGEKAMNAIRKNGWRLLVGLAVFAAVGTPAAFAVEKSPFCEKASQCRGPLPHFCRRCDNGHSACAHWACIKHHCEIATCGA